MEGAMQQAAQEGRQFMVVQRANDAVVYIRDIFRMNIQDKLANAYRVKPWRLGIATEERRLVKVRVRQNSNNLVDGE